MKCNNCNKWAGAYAGFAKDHDLCICPKKKEWVGLTDEEILFVRNKGAWTHDIVWSYERAIEAKLKEKNT